MTSRGLLTVLLVTALASPALAQEQVARVKSAPQDYRGRAIDLQGEVVEVQALSPRSRQGIYRLVDPTDRAGVLIRTSDLPETGGPFRVRAALSPELLRGGQLLLDETRRQPLRTSSLPVALGVAGLGLAAVIWSIVVYIAARRRERRMRLAPPLWLIPAGTERKPGEEPAPGQHFDYQLQYVEEERSAHIEARKRRALLAVVPGLLIALAGSIWAGTSWRAEASQPSFVLLEPDFPGAGPAPVIAADTASPRPDDTLRVVVQPPAPVPTPVPFDTARRRRPRRDTVAVAIQAVPPAAARDTARAAPAPVIAAAETTVSTPPPPPPPAPEPEPERRAPEPPAPDPAAVRRAAEEELQSGIARFVSAVAAREAGAVATLYPAGGDTRRVRFLDFIRDSRPDAALRGTEPVTVTENAAQAQFTISFRWRGEFGVARRKDAKFQASARRTGAGWAFEGARLLENMP